MPEKVPVGGARVWEVLWASNGSVVSLRDNVAKLASRLTSIRANVGFSHCRDDCIEALLFRNTIKQRLFLFLPARTPKYRSTRKFGNLPRRPTRRMKTRSRQLDRHLRRPYAAAMYAPLRLTFAPANRRARYERNESGREPCRRAKQDSD